MGTYTSNYNLFMPSLGEQGWGELVNNNFSIIDTTMKGFDNVLSKMTWDGDNVTFPGSVAANGGFNLGSLGTINTESGLIGGLYFNNAVTIAGSIAGTNSNTKTYIYKANPICNDVTFYNYIRVANGWSGATGKVTVNGVEVFNYSFGTANSSGSKSVTVTLNDGDEIVATVQGNGAAVAEDYIQVVYKGYLIGV